MANEILNREMHIVEDALLHNPSAIVTYGNRILTDLVFDRENKNAIVGVIVRETGVRLGRCIQASHEKEVLEPAKMMIRELLNEIGNEKDGFSAYWSSYHNFHNTTRKNLIPVWEMKRYDSLDEQKRKRIIEKRFDVLISLIRENQDVLYKPNNLLNGITVEAERISIELGGTPRTTLFVVMVRHLFSHYLYTLQYTFSEEGPDIKAFRNAFSPTIERFLRLTQEGTSDIDIEKMNIFLLDILADWRKYFIMFGELQTQVNQEFIMSDGDKVNVAKALKEALERRK